MQMLAAEEVLVHLPRMRWLYFDVSLNPVVPGRGGPEPSQGCCSGKASLFSMHTSRTQRCHPVIDCGMRVTVLSEFSPECTCRHSCHGFIYFPRARLSPSVQPCSFAGTGKARFLRDAISEQVLSVFGPHCVPAITLSALCGRSLSSVGTWTHACPTIDHFPACEWAHLLEGPLLSLIHISEPTRPKR